VIDISPRRFRFGIDRHAGYRVPFLFIENGIIKGYFLQPRKGAGLNVDDFGMVATVLKRDLLDIEFYGEQSDVEFIDVSAPDEHSRRAVTMYNMGGLRLWSERRLGDRLTLISEALDWAGKSGRIEKRRRVFRRPEAEMPLFD
jgi:hypothetical protein